MRGTMLWFNLDKDVGVITVDGGERLDVTGPAFVDGVRPKLRCSGTVVDFRVVVSGGEKSAVDVALLPPVVPARARRRYRRWAG